MITAHCRNCEAQGPRANISTRTNLGTKLLPDTYDVCKACGSNDVDILTPEGVAHEEVSA